MALGPVRTERRATGSGDALARPGPDDLTGFPGDDGRYDDLIRAAAARHHFAPRFVKAVIFVESHFNPSAISKRGACGLMQITAETAQRMGCLSPLDPAENIEAGTRYLRELLDRYRGDLKVALAAYSAGPRKVKKYGGKQPPYRETRLHFARITKAFSEYLVLPAKGPRGRAPV